MEKGKFILKETENNDEKRNTWFFVGISQAKVMYKSNTAHAGSTTMV